MIKKIYLLVFLSIMVFSFYKVMKYYNDNSINIFSDIENIESNAESALADDNTIKEIYGLSNLLLSPQEIENTLKEADGFLLPITNTDYDVQAATDKIAELSDVCKKNNTDFAYISFPSKNMSDDYKEEFYITGNNEQLRANFLKNIEVNGIDILDIRKLMEDDGLTYKDIFYKTDHHWNTESGLYAAREISKYINDTYNHKTYPENLDDDKLLFKEYKDSWFGETGRQFSTSWVGALDDFTLIKPKYNVSLEYKCPGLYDEIGDFSVLLDESILDTDYDLYTTSLHYCYMPDAGVNTIVYNNSITDGAKVLVVKDSFSMTVVPFLALTCSEVNMWDMRDNTESLYDYIANNDFDIVIMEYTDYWSDDMYAFY